MNTVYKYGCTWPHTNLDLVQQQMRAAHAYYNALVALERQRRDELRALEAQAADMPDVLRRLRDARQARELATTEITRHRAKSKKRDEPKQLRQALKDARIAERASLAEFRETRRRVSADEHVIAERDAIKERSLERKRTARAECGAFWGTYLLIEEAASKSFSDTDLYDDAGQPCDPRFRRWDDQGAIAVQLQGGLTVAALYGGGDTRARLTPPDERAWQRLPGVRSRMHCRDLARQAELSIRIGSEGRAPIWASVRLDMHRPLPPDAIITWITVHRRRIGQIARWDAVISFRQPARPALPIKADAIAIDVGWRVIGDELRVAGWYDSDGNKGEVRLGAKDLAALRAPDAVRAERDVRFDLVRLQVAGWLRDHQSILPEWLRVTAANLSAWRAERRLIGLFSRLRENRFPGDDALYDRLVYWQLRAKDEWSYESGLRGRALRRRREIYRIFAARVAEHYGTVVIENFDKRAIARRAPTEAGSADNETARLNRVLAATSELTVTLKNACRAHRRLHVAMPCKDSSRTCPACGLVTPRDAENAIVLVCECGHSWDQDIDGAPVVLLARWRERPGDARVLVDPRDDEMANEDGSPKENRWQKVRRMRVEKVARLQAARTKAASAE